MEILRYASYIPLFLYKEEISKKMTKHSVVGIIARAITATIPAGLVGFVAYIFTRSDIPVCEGFCRCVMLPASLTYVVLFIGLLFVPDHRKARVTADQTNTQNSSAPQR